MSERLSGTVTFVFTDIEGSTSLLKQLGRDQFGDLVADQQRLLREVFVANRGEEIDTQGDSFFVAFRSALDAVEAAVAIQRMLSDYAWPQGVELRVRIGIHTGEAAAAGERYVGLSVHRAARVAAAGHGGQVLLSATTSELIEDDLPPGVTLRDLGERRLKDLDRPERIFQLVISGLPSDFEPLRTLDLDRGRKRRLSIYVGSTLLAVIVAAVAVPVFLLGGGTGGTLVAPNSVGLIDASTNRLVDQIAVGIRPDAVTVDGDSVWVANRDDQTLTRIDARTRQVVRTISLNATPTGIAGGGGLVWVAEGPAGALARVDPVYNRVTRTFANLTGPVRVSGAPTGSVALGAGSVWAAYGNSTVVRVDPATSRVVNTDFAGFSASAIAYGAGAVWVANRAQSTVSRLSPITNRKILDVNVGRAPSGVAVGGGAVWVADTGDDAVSRIDPRSNASRTVTVGQGPVGIAAGADAIWVANSEDGSVSRIDPRTNEAVARIEVGGSPVAVAVSRGVVWVVVAAP